MRLGILGPSQGNLPALARSAQMLLDEIRADKIIYLADDGALDRVVAQWAAELVKAKSAAETAFDRAAARCVNATSDAIDAFVSSERMRIRLKIFVSVPVGKRLLELVGGRVAMFVNDKAMLDDRDMSGATLFTFGNNDDALIMRLGARTFLSPGPIGSLTGGIAVIEDAPGGVRIEMLNSAGMSTQNELIPSMHAAAQPNP